MQARDSLVCKQYGRVLRAAPQDDLFYQRLRSASDVKMALMVRASRNLPIKLLAGEYERILRRRLAVVGGSPDDPALGKMIKKFRYSSHIHCTACCGPANMITASQACMLGAGICRLGTACSAFAASLKAHADCAAGHASEM